MGGQDRPVIVREDGTARTHRDGNLVHADQRAGVRSVRVVAGDHSSRPRTVGRVQDGNERCIAAGAGLRAYSHVGKVEGGSQVGSSRHIAATISSQRLEVHGTFRYNAGTARGGRIVNRDDSRIGNAETAGRSSQITIYPFFVAGIGWDVDSYRFGARNASIRSIEICDIDGARIGCGIVHREIFGETPANSPFGKVPQPVDRSGLQVRWWRSGRRWCYSCGDGWAGRARTGGRRWCGYRTGCQLTNLFAK